MHHDLSTSSRSNAAAEEANCARASTRSLTGSILEQIVENGRTYANAHYFMPTDEAEQTRLAVTHQAFLLLLDGKLTMAHVQDSVKRILDVGTGPGDWAIAMGERYPNAEIIATDISACQPTQVPPNVVFQYDDAQENWTYSAPFDYIHVRGMAGAFSDWTSIYGEAFRHLKHNGTIEIADFGNIELEQKSSDSYVSIYNGACRSAAEKAGTPIGLDHLKRSLLESAGFSVMKSMNMQVPLGMWSPDPHKRLVGKMALISALEGLEASSMRLLTKQLAWTAKDVRDLCLKVQEEVSSPNAHASMQCQFVLARRLVLPE